MIKFGMKLPEIFNQLVRGYQKVRGQKPTGLDLIKIKQEAMLRFQEMRKVLDMQRNPIDPSQAIMGGTQQGNALKSGIMKATGAGPEVVEGINPKFIDFTINSFKNMDGIKVMKEANKVIKREGPYKDLTKNDAKRIMDAVDDKLKNIDMDPEDMYANGGRIGLKGGGQDASKSDFKSTNTNSPGHPSNRTTSPSTNKATVGGGGGSKPPPVIRRTGDGGVTKIKLKKPIRFNNIDNDFTKFNMKDLISYGLVNPNEEDENIKLAEAINFGLLPGAKDTFEASFPMFYDKNSTFQGNKYTATTKGGFVDALQKGTFGLKTEDMFNKNINSLFEGVADNEIGTGITDDAKPTYVRTGTGLDYTGYIDVPKKDLGKKELGMLPENFFVEEKADGGRIGLKNGEGIMQMASNDMNERLLEKIFDDLLDQGMDPEEAEIKAREIFNQMGDMSSMPDRGAQSIKLADGGITRVGLKDGLSSKLNKKFTIDGGTLRSMFFNRNNPILTGFNASELFDLAVRNIGPAIGLADGGRAAFKDGPKDPRRRGFMKAAVGVASMLPFGIGKGVKMAAPAIEKAVDISGPALAKIVETVMSLGKTISQSGKRVKEMITKKKHKGVEVEEDIMDGSYTIKKGGKEIYYKPGRQDEMGIDDDIIEVIEKTVTKKASGGVARLLGE